MVLSMVSLRQAHLDCAEIGHKGTAISKPIKPKKNCFSKVSVDCESTRHRRLGEAMRQNATNADMCTGSPSVSAVLSEKWQKLGHLTSTALDDTTPVSKSGG